jgi:gamma-glutamyltranspeptidase/glutathione hydrolase
MHRGPLVLAPVVLAALLPFAAAALPAASTGGMVVTAHATASDAGAAILQQGGNAADAAVAAAFVLAVVEPYSSGIGGGGFAVVRSGETLAFLDFREVAPARATRDMFLRDGAAVPELSRDGALSVAVPGAVAGYLALHERFGKLPRAAVLAPAIRAAEEGFTVDERYRSAARVRLELLRADPDANRIFLAGGDVPPPGARIVQKDLAATLRAIAAGGARAFQEGPVGKRLAADMQRRGGLVGAEDLRRYAVTWRAPLVGSYLGHAVATAPLPSSGGTILLTLLNALEKLPPGQPFHDPDALHLYLEASRRAFADRALLGDPAFVPDPTALLVAKGRDLGIGWSATRSSAVPPGAGTRLAATTTAAPATGGDHTTHLCTLDAAGDAVSLTSTVNYYFGAGIVAAGTGVLWNDQMDDFASAPGVPNSYGIVGSQANAIAPGKRPLSSMAPTLVFEGAQPSGPLRMVIGSPGGSRIPTSVAQGIWNHLAYGADVATAIALPRLHHQHLPDAVDVEPFALEPATAGLLLLRGHRLVPQPAFGNVMVIGVDPATGLRTGAADPRGVGTAVGVP